MTKYERTRDAEGMMSSSEPPSYSLNFCMTSSGPIFYCTNIESVLAIITNIFTRLVFRLQLSPFDLGTIAGLCTEYLFARTVALRMSWSFFLFLFIYFLKYSPRNEYVLGIERK